MCALMCLCVLSFVPSNSSNICVLAFALTCVLLFVSSYVMCVLSCVRVRVLVCVLSYVYFHLFSYVCFVIWINSCLGFWPGYIYIYIYNALLKSTDLFWCRSWGEEALVFFGHFNQLFAGFSRVICMHVAKRERKVPEKRKNTAGYMNLIEFV